jgi:hypothetical protein
MKPTVSPSSVRAMAAGAALASCALAAASSLQHSTLNTAYTIASFTNTYTSFTSNTPTTYVNSPMTTPGTASGTFLAYSRVLPTAIFDTFYVTVSNSNAYSSATFGMNFNVTLTRSAMFLDVGVSGTATIWTLNGNPLASFDVIPAGTYTFVGNGNYNGVSTNSFSYGMVLGVAPPAAGVPLPGAAGLAAVGLVGLRGRRRR